MNAAIIAVGSELLTPFRTDTNSLAITTRLNAIGYDVRLKVVVGDNVHELTEWLLTLTNAHDLVVCTGGLGPTDDDVTRDALSRAFEMPLERDDAIVDGIRVRFERRGMTMQAINARQGLVPKGATVLPNAFGTAPGLWIERPACAVVVLPGPPREMTPMFEAVVRDRLAPRTGGAGLFRRVLKITGRVESEVDAIAQPLYGPWATADVPIATTILAVMGQIELHLTAAARDRAAADVALDAAVSSLERALGVSVYSVDGRPLEAVVGGLLIDRGSMVAAAESCTGGLLLSRLTDVPGSSAYVDRGVVCYSDRSKVDLVGVRPETLAAHGAVSEAVAREMAEGIRTRAASAVGIGITGIAGPGGGTPEKPVGTVAIAVATGADVRVRTFHFLGGRDLVKFQSTQAALNMLRLMLVGE